MRFFLLSVALFSACSSPSTGIRGGTKAGRAEADKKHEDSAGNGSLPSNPAAPSPAPTPATPDEELMAEAQEPAIVSGSYLYCVQSGSKGVLACGFRDAKGAERILAATTAVSWVIVSNAGVRSELNKVTRSDSPAGTLFFVEVGALVGQLQASIAGEAVKNFETASLEATTGATPAPIAQEATKPETVWEFLAFAEASTYALGDPTADSAPGTCLGTNTRADRAASVTRTIEYTLEANVLQMMITDVCALQSRGAFVEISGPAGFTPLRMELSPGLGSRSLLLRENFAMPRGVYTFKVSSRVDGAGNVDDISFSNIIMTIAEGNASPAMRNPTVAYSQDP